MPPYISPSRLGECSRCGKAVQVSSTSATVQVCITCRRADPAPNTLLKRQKRQEILTVVCQICGDSETYPWAPRRRKWCSRCSPPLKNGKRRGLHSNPGGSSWISRERRLRIYVRDSWTCQICDGPVLREYVSGADRSASLDHIEPQSHVLIPDHSDGNLRTACLLCNNVRNDGRLTDAEVSRITEGRRSSADIAA